MAKVEIKLNRRGVRELLKSPELIDYLEHKAYQTRQATGHPDDYAVSSKKGKNRANASIHVIKASALKRNKKIGGNELIKAVGSVKEQ